MDLSAIDDSVTLSKVVSTTIEAYGLLCLENSKEKWTEEATYRGQKKMWKGQKLDPKVKNGCPKSKCSECKGDKLNGWNNAGIEICTEINRDIKKFSTEDIDTGSNGNSSKVVKKQKLFEEYLEEVLDTDYGKSRRASPLESAQKR